MISSNPMIRNMLSTLAIQMIHGRGAEFNELTKTERYAFGGAERHALIAYVDDYTIIKTDDVYSIIWHDENCDENEESMHQLDYNDRTGEMTEVL